MFGFSRFTSVLAGYDPNDYLIFNWCEELPGIPEAAHWSPKLWRNYGFTYTGADSQALAFSQDKPKVKERLHKDGIPTPRWKIFTDAASNGWNTFPAIVKPAFEHCSIGISPDCSRKNTGRISLLALLT